MKKKPYKYLKLYREWMKTGEMSYAGLCLAIPSDGKLFFKTMFKPTTQELIEHEKDGYGTCYWGRKKGAESAFAFTPFRQNIILFLAAMNNEL